MTKLVYIGGYGHSGSTLLEYLLAAIPEVTACGEVASVVRERGRKAKCTCGRLAKECVVWGELQESGSSLDGWSHERLVVALAKRLDRPGAIMVDSSKTPRGSLGIPSRLATALGTDFILVHLVRDPRAVAWSAVKKSGRQGTQPLIGLRTGAAALGWTAANLACERFGRGHPESYVRLRYEDVVSDPVSTLRALIARIAPDAMWRPEQIGAHDNRHQLYGNRMRGKPLALSDIKEDAAWRKDMPDAYQKIAAALTTPLRKRYGYT